MANIFYTTHHGSQVGIWPGKSVRKEGVGPRKVGQIYLGKVIDREKNVFWTRERGFYAFNPIDQTFGEAPESSIPPAFEEPSRRCRKAPVIVDFGDSYFINTLIYGIKYNKVIDAISFQNRDSLYGALSYYILESNANYRADSWIKQNYASYLYPKSNFASQRFSDMLASIGKPENVRNFLLEHIKYLTDIYGDDLCILIDSTGLENSCKIPITCFSNHNGDVNLEFRIVAIVQKSTGIPIFYECIPGNIIDVTTLKRIIILLKEYGCNVEYCITDAGYLCPSNIERLVMSGIEFMSRLNPNFKLYKKAIDENLQNLDNDENVVRFKNRFIHIIKTTNIVAIDKETGEEKIGFIYLCKDIQSAQSKTDHLLSSKAINKMTTQEILDIKKKFGVFAIITTKDLEPEKVLPEYYLRQSVEQYFDYGKNYAKFIPVRQQNMETLAGHLLLSFIASFLIIVIKNKLNIIDLQYVAIPQNLSLQYGNYDKNQEIYIKQETISNIVNESPLRLFQELRGQKADVFQSRIIPSCPVKIANDFYHAFKIESPLQVRRENEKLVYEFEKNGNNVTKEIAFAQKPYITDKEIVAQRAKQQQAQLENKTSDASCSNEQLTKDLEKSTEAATEQKPKRGPGRPPGRKNNKTLEREAAMKAASGCSTDSDTEQKPKRGRGRPPGRKNNKTLEREAAMKAASDSSANLDTEKS